MRRIATPNGRAARQEPRPMARGSRHAPYGQGVAGDGWAPGRVWAALVDPGALMAWLPPGGMTGRFERFDARPGGSYRQYAFRRHYDTTPTVYMRQVRLEQLTGNCKPLILLPARLSRKSPAAGAGPTRPTSPPPTGSSTGRRPATRCAPEPPDPAASNPSGPVSSRSRPRAIGWAAVSHTDLAR